MRIGGCVKRFLDDDDDFNNFAFRGTFGACRSVPAKRW